MNALLKQGMLIPFGSAATRIQESCEVQGKYANRVMTNAPQRKRALECFCPFASAAPAAQAVPPAAAPAVPPAPAVPAVPPVPPVPAVPQAGKSKLSAPGTLILKQIKADSEYPRCGFHVRIAKVQGSRSKRRLVDLTGDGDAWGFATRHQTFTETTEDTASVMSVDSTGAGRKRKASGMNDAMVEVCVLQHTCNPRSLKKMKNSFIDIDGTKLAVRNTAYDIETLRELVRPIVECQGVGVNAATLVTAAEMEIRKYLYATNAGTVEHQDTAFLRTLASKVSPSHTV